MLDSLVEEKEFERNFKAAIQRPSLPLVDLAKEASRPPMLNYLSMPNGAALCATFLDSNDPESSFELYKHALGRSIQHISSIYFDKSYNTPMNFLSQLSPLLDNFNAPQKFELFENIVETFSRLPEFTTNDEAKSKPWETWMSAMLTASKEFNATAPANTSDEVSAFNNSWLSQFKHPYIEEVNILRDLGAGADAIGDFLHSKVVVSLDTSYGVDTAGTSPSM